VALSGVLVVLVAVVALVEAARFRRAGAHDARFPANVAMMGLFQLALIFATGALESPVMPAILPFAVAAAVVIGPRARLAWVTVPQLVAVWVFALGALYGFLPDVNLPFLGGGVRAGHSDAHLWTSAVVLTGALVIATSVGLGLRGLFDGMLARALDARAAELAAHRDHAAELGALSGEIAHELKNPLATVKGLAALLERDVEGRAAERLAVLRGEVDRMQGILEEFLNFSRPLVPLQQEPVDLGALAREVATLHEGMARGRHVAVGVEPGDAPEVRGDRRKVRQVLINLVQNALDASPRNGEVRIRAVGDDGGARVEVLDRGAGPPEGLGERVFEAGVTTKATGNGLGLTIARALARQHGGELLLEPREGGGCRALLTLPREAP
jgi:two-component system, NtrC family, sensor histidine kinase HydH